MITKADLEIIESLRADAHADSDGELGICDVISEAIQKTFGWELRCGRYLPDKYLDYHCWNLLPDGSILDASADQFGLPGIVIYPPGSVEHGWYQHKKRYMQMVFSNSELVRL